MYLIPTGPSLTRAVECFVRLLFEKDSHVMNDYMALAKNNCRQNASPVSNEQVPHLPTSIMAWKTPSLTLSFSCSSCTFLKKAEYSSLPFSGPADLWKSGFVPFLVEARRVNWETQSTSPLISLTLFFH